MLLISFLVLYQSAQAEVPPVHLAQRPLMHGNSGMTASVLSSAKMMAGDTFLYQAGFDAIRWRGVLQKFAVISLDDGGVGLNNIPEWEAGEILSGNKSIAAIPLPEERRIYTGLPSIVPSIVEFKWEELAEIQRSMLGISPSNGSNDALGSQRLNFLRGARDMEVGQPKGIFRLRDGVLGDIANSNLVYVGAPERGVGAADYLQFYEAHKNRPPAIYVGANDGMLHAFDAKNGSELFAYIPQIVIPHLPQLSQLDYVHRPYVDGTIAVAEAKVLGKWKTVLASGMGGGGQGVFALDVTEPAEFSVDAGVLWEFTDRDDADLGNVMSAPLIAKFRIKIVDGVAEYRHFVVVSAGVNNYLDDAYVNPLAPAVLFLLSLDKPPAQPWQLGVNYFKFSKPIADTNLQNGLGALALVAGEDGAVRYMYAGDLQGNLWRFNFLGNAPWSKENLSATPLFIARDSQQHRQPITMPPRVVFAPGGGYVILFGTGKFIEQADSDPSGFASQSFYAIYDTLQANYAVSDRSQLATRTLSQADDFLAFAGTTFNYGTSTNDKRGWYFDFVNSIDTGERSVGKALLESGRLIFNSLIPCVDPCLEGGGRSYVLDVLSGLPIDKNVSGMLSRVGMLAPPLLLSTSTTSSGRSSIGKAIVRRKSVVINTGRGGAKGSVTVGQGDAEGGLISVDLPAMRFSWREILRWQELRLLAKPNTPSK